MNRLLSVVEGEILKAKFIGLTVDVNAVLTQEFRIGIEVHNISVYKYVQLMHIVMSL